MCMASKPKAPQPVPVPPPPPGAPEIDQQIIDQRDRARRRQQSRAGRLSTILAGDDAPVSPTAQAKPLLGS